MCFICQEHEPKDGHETKWCPKNICKKCGQNGHTKIGCMSEMEDLPFPKKILNKIVTFLTVEDLNKFSIVSKKCSEIGQIEIVRQKLMADFKPNKPHLTCNLCAKHIEFGIYYHCSQLQCNEADICDRCFNSEGHPHVMEKNNSMRNLAIDRCIKSLVHATSCRNDANCHEPSCNRMKRVVTHTRQCTRKSNGGCPICKQLIALCCYHVKICSESNCPVIFCQNIKAKLAAQAAAYPTREVPFENLNEVASLKIIKSYKKKEERELCWICQKLHVGHETKWCPSIICKKCGKSGHAKMQCMFEMENLPMPDEILLKILGYLNLGDLIECSKVSKRLKGVCLDKTLSYHTYHSAIIHLSLQDEKIIINVLKDNPNILETEIEVSTKAPEKTKKRFLKISRFWESWKVPLKQGLLSYEKRDSKIILEVLPLQKKRPFEVIEETDETDQESDRVNVKRLKLVKN